VGRGSAWGTPPIARPRLSVLSATTIPRRKTLVRAAQTPHPVVRRRPGRAGRRARRHRRRRDRRLVGIYDITFKTPTGSKLPLDLGGARIFVESTRLLPFGENKITPFLTNVSFDVAAIC
jgi:hypothetical protein